MRALIVDDEPLARRGVALRLEKFRDIDIVGECGDGLSAVKKILELSPDIVFLDIQMPGMDGFDVLRALPRESLPKVIFLTAYEQHALRAFEVHALDYLLKPVDDVRFAGFLLGHFNLRKGPEAAWASDVPGPERAIRRRRRGSSGV